jgi:hypothetical protein
MGGGRLAARTVRVDIEAGKAGEKSEVRSAQFPVLSGVF